ncbi:MAG TPA: hypothetical protein DEQ38_11075 [Elusimicrobia bacterium]|nr:MAG: hypothetical protein A2089_05815 [Elusimicrobia bacterium GWD2_63_28]OGR78930.1 MAG: hypothetical protein A2X38_03170 [Elusimicrobia bacterium GWC2_61_25]HCC48638.1 hypothetical protein [Elusimicrobiota bacterium]
MLSVCLLLACACPAAAVFEDLPAGARQSGFGGQAAGLEDPLAFQANPALAGSSRKFETGAHFLGSERTTQGPGELRAYGAWALVPRMAYGKMGTLSIGGLYRDDGGEVTQKTISFGWGTWQLRRGGSGVLDLGANLKILSATAPGGESASGAAVDLGAVFRPDDRHSLGFSILNLNNPAFDIGGLEDNAPMVIRLGVSERREDYTLSLDLAKRTASAGQKGNVSLNPGVEHAWRTQRAGQLFSRAGLFLAERASALSAGIGWKHLASEISYGLAVPLTGAVVPAHSLTLALRFGDRDVEAEYERLIKQEIKYRKDLVEALDESARREALLKDELASMKAEIDSLSARLKSTQEQKAAESGEKERLASVVRRQAAAEAELRAMSEKRKADKLAQLRYDFSAEWQGYLKLKGGGAPADVLKSSLQRIVSQYQDSGIDISQATVELQGLVR